MQLAAATDLLWILCHSARKLALTHFHSAPVNLALKKIDFPATVHLTSDELEARDLTFSLTVGGRSCLSWLG
jgi:hypothetical protein